MEVELQHQVEEEVVEVLVKQEVQMAMGLVVMVFKLVLLEQAHFMLEEEMLIRMFQQQEVMEEEVR